MTDYESQLARVRDLWTGLKSKADILALRAVLARYDQMEAALKRHAELAAFDAACKEVRSR